MRKKDRVLTALRIHVNQANSVRLCGTTDKHIFTFRTLDLDESLQLLLHIIAIVHMRDYLASSYSRNHCILLYAFLDMPIPRSCDNNIKVCHVQPPLNIMIQCHCIHQY